MSKKSFKDNNDNTWTPKITGNVIYEYEMQTGISMFSAIAEQGLPGIIPGFKELMTLLYLSVKKQAQELHINEIDFRNMIYGEVFEDAAQALSEAVFDFFPKLRRLGEAMNENIANLGLGGDSIKQPPSQE